VGFAPAMAVFSRFPAVNLQQPLRSRNKALAGNTTKIEEISQPAIATN